MDETARNCLTVILMRHAIVLDYTICQIPFQFLQRLKIAEIIKIHDFLLFACPMHIGSFGISRFTI